MLSRIVSRRGCVSISRKWIPPRQALLFRRHFGAQATLATQQQFFKPLSNPAKYIEELDNKDDLLENVIFPEIFPLTEDSFGRMDKRPDGKFYAEPR